MCEPLKGKIDGCDRMKIWICQFCNYENELKYARCQSCGKIGKREIKEVKY